MVGFRWLVRSRSGGEGEGCGDLERASQQDSVSHFQVQEYTMAVMMFLICLRQFLTGVMGPRC